MTTKTFGYCRISSSDQNEDRQIHAMLNLGIEERDIFLDKSSGKNFERPNYQALKTQLRNGDILVIKSIDRLGRNYKQICDEWKEITQTKKVHIKVLDLPLLDTTKTEGLVGQVISDIVLQLLGFVAEQERTFIRERQAEGIACAKRKGKKFGRPSAKFPTNWETIYTIWKQKRITARDAMNKLNLKPTTFYKLVKIYEKKLGESTLS
ncbi:recombinase family protein [bacterium]|nr:recombinase family protein [bacterium]